VLAQSHPPLPGVVLASVSLVMSTHLCIMRA
jgi:hypothetical protein